MDKLLADKEFSIIVRDTEEAMMNCGNEIDHRMFKYFMPKIYRQRELFFSNR